MKITFIINGLSGGGAERVASNLASSLINKHRVTIVSLEKCKPAYPLPKDINLVFLNNNPVKGFEFLLITRKKLKAFFKNDDSDIYIVFLPIASILTLGLKRHIKAPIICSERNNPDSYSRIYKFLLKHFLPRSDAIVFQTEDARKWYIKRDSKCLTKIIPNPISDKILNFHNGISEKENKVIAVGRLVEQKNFHLLLQSFALFLSRFPNYNLEICGDGILLEDLIDFAKKLNIDKSVVFSGFKDNIEESVSRAKIFVLSSNFEGMPNALIEALALGTACISTDCPCGGPRFLINNMVNGILVPVNDHFALYEAMCAIAENETIRRKLERNSVEIKKILNPSIIMDEWENFIKEVYDSGSC